MRKIIFFMSLVLFFTSCDEQSEDAESLAGKDVGVVLRADFNGFKIDSLDFSRSSVAENTSLNVFMDLEEPSSFGMKTFTIAADGLLSYSGDEHLTYPQGRTVRFLSVYPVPQSWPAEFASLSDLNFDFEVSEDQSSGFDAANDYCYAFKQGSASNPDVTLSYEHKCSMLSVAVKAGENTTVDDLTGAYAVIRGVKRNAEFSFTTGSVVAVGEPDNIEMAGDCVSDDFSKSASALLPPQTIETETAILSLVIGDKQIEVVSENAIEFSAGKNNIFYVTVNKDEAQQISLVVNSTVEDWQTVTTDLDISFDEEENEN